MKLKNLNTFSLFPLYMIPKIVVVGVLIVLLGIFASLISQVFKFFQDFWECYIFLLSSRQVHCRCRRFYSARTLASNAQSISLIGGDEVLAFPQLWRNQGKWVVS